MDQKSFKNKALYIAHLENKVRKRKNIITTLSLIIIGILIAYFTVNVSLKFIGVTPYTQLTDETDATNKTEIQYVYVNQTGNLSNWKYWNSTNLTWKYWNNGTSDVQQCDEDSQLLKATKAFFGAVFNEKNSWLYSLLLFLGIVYLIQVGFSIVGDIIELVLVMIVASKRLIQGIIRKVKPQKDPVYNALINVKGGNKNNDKIR